MRASKNGSRNKKCAIARAPRPAGVGAVPRGSSYARLGTRWASGRAVPPICYFVHPAAGKCRAPEEAVWTYIRSCLSAWEAWLPVVYLHGGASSVVWGGGAPGSPFPILLKLKVFLSFIGELLSKYDSGLKYFCGKAIGT